MPPTHFEGGNVNMFQPYVVGQSGHRQSRPGAGDEAAGEKQEDGASRDELGETVKHAARGRQEGWRGRKGSVLPVPAFLPACPAC